MGAGAISNLDIGTMVVVYLRTGDSRKIRMLLDVMHMTVTVQLPVMRKG